MAGAVLESPGQAPFAEWTAGLNRKQTFEATCKALANQPTALTAPESRALVARARTLLRSRFTGRPYWVAGRTLFRSALAQAGGDGAFAQQLREFIAECDQELGDSAGPSSDAAPAAAATHGRGAEPFLFEGQLGAAEPAAAAPALSLHDLLGGALMQQMAAQAQAGTDGSAAQQAGAEPQQGGAGQQQGAQQQALSPAALEALERELDAIAVRLMEETAAAAPPRAPPASKRVVAALPQETLDAARLAELGAGVRCPVCMEELAVGDAVLQLPCKHTFHPPCLAPWLESNNSCPTCRHELETDDWRYESAKERAKQEAEEQRGAANAVSHNEFLYI